MSNKIEPKTKFTLQDAEKAAKGYPGATAEVVLRLVNNREYVDLAKKRAGLASKALAGRRGSRQALLSFIALGEKEAKLPIMRGLRASLGGNSVIAFRMITQAR